MRREVIAHKDPKSPISEIFRTLRTNIQFMNTSKKMKTLLITSTFPSEGKSWTASNLAVTFAQAGKKVILIDADMRKGRQYAIFGVSPKPGLSNYLSGIDLDENDNETIDLADYIQETEVENLYLMAAGNIPPNPSELLVSAQMINLLEKLKTVCDIVIIDGTPCELVADSIILSRLADSTVVVTAHKYTKKDALDRVIKNIKNVGGNLAGVVINKMPITSKKYNQSYYYGSSNKMGKASGKVNAKNKKQSNIGAKNAKPVNLKPKETVKPQEIEQKINKLEQSEIPKAFQNKIEIENADEISVERTQDILNQINDYLSKSNK